MKGLTLIETIIYIALLGILMVGAISTVYSLIESGVATTGSSTTQDEGNFVLAKISWALSQQDSVLVPSSGFSNTLTLITEDGTSVSMRKTGTVVEMRVDTGSYLPLTSLNVTVEDLGFAYTNNVFSASTTIDGKTFEIHRFLRK